ncbi:MAG: hypothetical protein KKC20_12280 [Proteobacteria bacterium]|nr:hypothetical protein [Pseudomonadota bacterium]
MKSNTYVIRTIKFGLVLLLAACLSGCWANLGSDSAEKSAYSAETHEKSKKTTAIYHDFEDVLVPMELSVMKDKTVVVSTPGFRSGILALRGRVDSTALFNFFSNNMSKDNWNVVSKIKSPDNTIMVFQKTSRCAVITIRESQVYTYVEIGVAPTLTNGGQTSGSGYGGSGNSGMTQNTLTD